MMEAFSVSGAIVVKTPMLEYMVDGLPTMPI
jgi:hypothetical protein